MKARQFLDRFGRQVDEGDAVNEHGILRDGYALRTPLIMKDGRTNQQQIDHAIAETKKAMQKDRGVRDAIVIDLIGDETKRAAYADKSAADCSAWRQVRPAPVAPARVAAANDNDAKQAAYADASHAAQNAWREPK